MMLGLNEIKRLIYILSFRDLTAKSHSSQKEIIKISLIRAKLCELLAKRTGRPQPSSYMLIGMFSLIDTLLHRELEDIIKELPLIDEVGQAPLVMKTIIIRCSRSSKPLNATTGTVTSGEKN